MNAFKFIVEDLSHLGGPMGTEYTTVIDTEIALSWEGAVKLFEKGLREFRGRGAPAKMDRPPVLGKFYDFGGVGFVIKKTTLHE